jgi:hypothetical protein
MEKSKSKGPEIVEGEQKRGRGARARVSIRGLGGTGAGKFGEDKGRRRKRTARSPVDCATELLRRDQEKNGGHTWGSGGRAGVGEGLGRLNTLPL